MTSSDTKTWLVTGAGRGMDVDFARAALAAGHNVVATARNPDAVGAAVGEHDNLLVARLDITDAQSAEQAAAAFWASMNAKRAGDPAKLARALAELADSAEPPLRWVAGEDVVEAVETKARLLLAQLDAHRELSSGLAHDDAQAAT